MKQKFDMTLVKSWQWLRTKCIQDKRY